MRSVWILFNFVENVAQAALLELKLAYFRPASPYFQKSLAQWLHADKANTVEAGERKLHFPQ